MHKNTTKQHVVIKTHKDKHTKRCRPVV